MNKFFSQIVYSAENEDPYSEKCFLDINKNDRVLCITGSGSRTLELLSENPKQIISVDLNETQNFLLEIKCIAFKVLSYAEFKRFIGLEKCSNRLQTYKSKIRPLLNNETAMFFDKNISFIHGGILYCGIWEGYLAKLSLLTKFKTKTLKKLLGASSLDEQWSIWEKEWDGNFWKQLLKMAGHRWVWKYILKEPGIEYVHKNADIGLYLHERINHSLKTKLVRENPFMNLILFGSYSNDCLPNHLQECNFDNIKANIDKVTIVTSTLTDYMDKNPESIDKFSVSDFSSYQDIDGYNQTWNSIYKAAKNGSRVCERHFLVNHNPMNAPNINIERDTAMEETLKEQDYAFIYSFNCIKVTK